MRDISVVADTLKRWVIYDGDGMRCGKIQGRSGQHIAIRFRGNFLSLEEWEQLDKQVRQIFAGKE